LGPGGIKQSKGTGIIAMVLAGHKELSIPATGTSAGELPAVLAKDIRSLLQGIHICGNYGMIDYDGELAVGGITGPDHAADL